MNKFVGWVLLFSSSFVMANSNSNALALLDSIGQTMVCHTSVGRREEKLQEELAQKILQLNRKDIEITSFQLQMTSNGGGAYRQGICALIKKN